MILIVGSNIDGINYALKLSVNEEEEAGVDGWVIESLAAWIHEDAPIVVNIGHSASHCIVIIKSAVLYLDQGGVLNVKHSPLISVVASHRAVSELGCHFLIVSEYYWASAYREVLLKDGIGHVQQRISGELNKGISSRVISNKFSGFNIQIKWVSSIWASRLKCSELTSIV